MQQWMWEARQQNDHWYEIAKGTKFLTGNNKIATLDEDDETSCPYFRVNGKIECLYLSSLKLINNYTTEEVSGRRYVHEE